MNDVNQAALTRTVIGALKSAQHAHPKKISKDIIHSISKRVVAQILANFNLTKIQPQPAAQ
jgi:hypothetical protein